MEGEQPIFSTMYRTQRVSLSNLKTGVILSIPCHVFTLNNNLDCNHDNHDQNQYNHAWTEPIPWAWIFAWPCPGSMRVHICELGQFCTAVVFQKLFAFFFRLFSTTLIRDAPQKNKRDFLGIFPKGGGGLRNSQNYFIFTVSFFVCQNMEVLEKQQNMHVKSSFSKILMEW